MASGPWIAVRAWGRCDHSQLHAHDEHIALADVRATAEVLHEVVTSYLTDV